MNFLNIGASELIVIIIIAILAVGPRRMVQIARTLGRTAAKLRRMSSEFLAIVNAELREVSEESQQALTGAVTTAQGEVKAADAVTKETLRTLRRELGSLQSELEAAANEARAFIIRTAQEAEAEEAGGTPTSARPPSEATTPAPTASPPPLGGLEETGDVRPEPHSQTDPAQRTSPTSARAAPAQSPSLAIGELAAESEDSGPR